VEIEYLHARYGVEQTIDGAKTPTLRSAVEFVGPVGK